RTVSRLRLGATAARSRKRSKGFSLLAGFGLRGDPGGVVGAAADRRVVQEETAGAARVEQAAQAVAARLNHGAALRVAAGAGNANAVFGRLVLARAHRQVAAVDGDAVERAVAAAQAAGQHRTQVLHHAA